MPVSTSILRYGTVVCGRNYGMGQEEADAVAGVIKSQSENYSLRTTTVLRDRGFDVAAGADSEPLVRDSSSRGGVLVSFPDVVFRLPEVSDYQVNLRLCLTVCHGEGGSKIWLRFILGPKDGDEKPEMITDENTLEEFREICEVVSREVTPSILELYQRSIESTLKNLRPGFVPSSDGQKLESGGTLIFMSSDLDDKSGNELFDSIDNLGLAVSLVRDEHRPIRKVVQALHKEVEDSGPADFVKYDAIGNLSGLFLRSVSDDVARLTGVCRPPVHGDEMSSHTSGWASPSQQMTRDLSIIWGRQF